MRVGLAWGAVNGWFGWVGVLVLWVGTDAEYDEIFSGDDILVPVS